MVTEGFARDSFRAFVGALPSLADRLQPFDRVEGGVRRYRGIGGTQRPEADPASSLLVALRLCEIAPRELGWVLPPAYALPAPPSVLRHLENGDVELTPVEQHLVWRLGSASLSFGVVLRQPRGLACLVGREELPLAASLCSPTPDLLEARLREGPVSPNRASRLYSALAVACGPWARAEMLAPLVASLPLVDACSVSARHPREELLSEAARELPLGRAIDVDSAARLAADGSAPPTERIHAVRAALLSGALQSELVFEEIRDRAKEWMVEDIHDPRATLPAFRWWFVAVADAVAFSHAFPFLLRGNA
ncbi:MAG: hypothetical protein H6737_25455 [Alphaproteobacteria bacterium]|nr:hypothetical protein [Alphaproteobacteria bacterium]